jgi:GT2 family glycosyltransferase
MPVSEGVVDGDVSVAHLRIAALMTCHNRRDLTLRCLARLGVAADQAASRAAVDTYLVDDGCTDGTGEAVQSQFPRVHLIRGNGELFWCGGMRLAWGHAARHDYDAYLWLNDDVALDEDALCRLIEVACGHRRDDGAVIAVGTTRDDGAEGDDGAASYGGMGDNGVMAPADEPRRIEIFNGNIVLVSRAAFRLIGGLSAAYTHGLGDFDYGVRARKAGIPVWLAAGTLGSCAANKTARWRQAGLPLWRRLQELHRPTGCPPWQLARLVWSNGGWWFPWSVAKLYWEVFFPSHEPNGI